MGSHRTSALTLELTLASTLKRNTLISITPLTKSVSISVNASVKDQIGPELIQSVNTDAGCEQGLRVNIPTDTRSPISSITGIT